jgi:hypothetical protein
MAVATFDAPDLDKRQRHMMHYGNAYKEISTATAVANSTSASKARLIRIPAGVMVSSIELQNTDMDSGASAAVEGTLGYEPVDGTTPAASANYFAADGVIDLGVAGRKVVNNFAPIKFERDVYLVWTFTTAASTFVAGTIVPIVNGVCVGAT